MTTHWATPRRLLAALTFRPRRMGPKGGWLCAWVAAVAAVSTLGGCTDPGSGEGRRRLAASAPASSSSVAPPASTMPEADRPVAGTRAALEMLSRPDVRPTLRSRGGERGATGALGVARLRDRQVFRCDYPVVLTWAPRSGWRLGSGTGRCMPGCSRTVCAALSRRALASCWVNRLALAGTPPNKPRRWWSMNRAGYGPYGCLKPPTLPGTEQSPCPVRFRTGAPASSTRDADHPAPTGSVLLGRYLGSGDIPPEPADDRHLRVLVGRRRRHVEHLRRRLERVAPASGRHPVRGDGRRSVLPRRAPR